MDGSRGGGKGRRAEGRNKRGKNEVRWEGRRERKTQREEQGRRGGAGVCRESRNSRWWGLSRVWGYQRWGGFNLEGGGVGDFCPGPWFGVKGQGKNEKRGEGGPQEGGGGGWGVGGGQLIGVCVVGGAVVNGGVAMARFVAQVGGSEGGDLIGILWFGAEKEIWKIFFLGRVGFRKYMGKWGLMVAFYMFFMVSGVFSGGISRGECKNFFLGGFSQPGEREQKP